MELPGDRYRIRREIGSGGMGTVYLATDSRLDRDVAVKMVHPHLLKEGTVKTRFLNEARAIAALSHENIVSLFDVGEENESFLIMEYIAGKTLQQVLQENQEIPNLVILEIGRQLFKGLTAAHEKNIVHRDIKPANIMIDNRGCLKITDFGVVHIIHQAFLTSTGQFLGTPQYISPEIVKAENISGQADVFSAGCVLYRCVTGQPPFTGDTPHRILQSVCDAMPSSPTALNPKTHPFIEEFVVKLLDKNPDHRPSALEAAEMIEKFCLENRMRTGMWRLHDFISDPIAYNEIEKKEISQHLLETAYMHEKAGKSASAHRYMHLAGLFGKTEGYDMSIKMGQSGKFSKAGIAVLLTVLAALAVIMWTIFWPVTNNKSQDQTFSSKAENRFSPAAPIGDNSKHNILAAENIPSVSRVGKDTAHYIKAIKKTEAEPRSLKRKAEGYLTVKTRPPFAKIYLNDNHAGQTPLTAPVMMKAGEYTLRVEKKGCETLKKQISIRSADTLNLAFELKKI